MKNKAVHYNKSTIDVLTPSEIHQLHTFRGTRLKIRFNRVQAFSKYITSNNLNYTVYNDGRYFKVVRLCYELTKLRSIDIVRFLSSNLPCKITGESDNTTLHVESKSVLDVVIFEAVELRSVMDFMHENKCVIDVSSLDTSNTVEI